MKITIKNKELEVKHSLRAIMFFEEATQKPFQIINIRDLVSYMYCSASVYNELEGISLDDFIDGLSDQDLNEFFKQMSQSKKKETPQKKPSLLARVRSLLTSH